MEFMEMSQVLRISVWVQSHSGMAWILPFDAGLFLEFPFFQNRHQALLDLLVSSISLGG